MDSQFSEIREFTQDDQSAELAIKYCQVLGQIPQTFGVTIRSLMIDRANTGELSEITCFQIKRLVKAPTLVASLYFGSKTFFPHSFEDGKPKEPANLAELYDPFSLAALFSNIYLFKRCKRLCSKDEWRFIAEPLQRNLEIGALLGSAHKPIGLGVGLITCFIFYAFAAFLAHDTPGFVEYRRHLKKTGLDFDAEYELSQWGCTSVQVACNILIALGFGVKTASAFYCGLSNDKNFNPEMVQHGGPYAMLRNWMNALHPNVAAAQLPSKELNQLSEQEQKELMQNIVTVYEHGSRFKWLERSKADINSKTMPDLLILEEDHQDQTQISSGAHEI